MRRLKQGAVPKIFHLKVPLKPGLTKPSKLLLLHSFATIRVNELRSFRPEQKLVRSNFFSCDLESNKWLTLTNKALAVETLFTLQVKAVEVLLIFQIQSAIDRSTDFVAMQGQQHF